MRFSESGCNATVLTNQRGKRRLGSALHFGRWHRVQCVKSDRLRRNAALTAERWVGGGRFDQAARRGFNQPESRPPAGYFRTNLGMTSYLPSGGPWGE